MPDFSYLLASKPVEVPGPMDLAGKGLTLGEMANKLAMGNLGLQTAQQQAALWQDPAMAPVLQGLIGGSGGSSTPEAIAALQSKYGLAVPGFVNQALTMGKNTAEIKSLTAGAEEKQNQVHQAGLTNLSNIAADFVQRPTAYGLQSMQRQMAHLASTGLPAENYTSMPDPKLATPEDIFSMAKNIAMLKTSPEQQAKIANISFEQWDKIASQNLKYAEAGKGEYRPTPEGTPYLAPPPFPGGPPQMPAPPGGAPTAPVGAASGGIQLGTLPNGGKIIQGPIVGATPKMLADVGADADKMMKAATPEDPYGLKGAIKDVVSNIGGGLRKEKLGPQEEQNVKGAGEEVNSLVTKAQSANQMQALVVDMRNKEAQGILSGGVQGAPFFSKIANIAAAMGAKGETIDKLQNTQAWSADSGHLIAQAVSQFAGARIAARELTFFENIKPQLVQTPEGREQIYQALYNISDRIKQQAAQAQDYVNDPKNLGKGLGGFEPKFKEVKIPSLQVPGLPDPASRKGWSATGDDGVTYKSDGARWVRQ